MARIRDSINHHSFLSCYVDTLFIVAQREDMWGRERTKRIEELMITTFSAHTIKVERMNERELRSGGKKHEEGKIFSRFVSQKNDFLC